MRFFPDIAAITAASLAAATPRAEPAEAPDAPHLQPTEGVKHDHGKLRMDLLPMDAIREVAAVMTFGAKKYGDRNWEKGMDWGRLIGAAHRHLSEFQLGVDIDHETDLLHTAHAATCLLFLLSYQLRATGNDDRAKLRGM